MKNIYILIVCFAVLCAHCKNFSSENLRLLKNERWYGYATSCDENFIVDSIWKLELKFDITDEITNIELSDTTIEVTYGSGDTAEVNLYYYDFYNLNNKPIMALIGFTDHKIDYTFPTFFMSEDAPIPLCHPDKLKIKKYSLKGFQSGETIDQNEWSYNGYDIGHEYMTPDYYYKYQNYSHNTIDGLTAEVIENKYIIRLELEISESDFEETISIFTNKVGEEPSIRIFTKHGREYNSYSWFDDYSNTIFVTKWSGGLQGDEYKVHIKNGFIEELLILSYGSTEEMSDIIE